MKVPNVLEYDSYGTELKLGGTLSPGNEEDDDDSDDSESESESEA